MRSTTKQKLDQALRRQWFNRAVMAAGLMALIGLGLWYTGLDASVTNKPAPGVIEIVEPAVGMTTQVVETGLSVTVKLDDGRVAKVIALKSTNPKVGEHATLTEHVHGSGRSTFSWK